MKKIAIMLLALVAVAALGFTQVGANKSSNVTIKLNNIEITSNANHIENGTSFVDVGAYFDLLDRDYTYDRANGTVSFDGKTVEVKVVNGVPTAAARSFHELVGGQEVGWNQEERTVYLLLLPEGAKKYHPTIPGMGQHWVVATDEQIVNETIDFHSTTIYGSYNGKLIFIEQMIDQAFLAEGKNAVFTGMEGLPSPSIDHSMFEFVPQGHPGFEVPHYDIHHYYVSHEEHSAILGGGGHEGH